VRLSPFIYYQPRTLSEFFDLLEDKEPRQTVLIGGGTDILVKIRHRLIKPSAVVTVRKIADFDKIEKREKSIFIGAAVTLQEIKSSGIIMDLIPALSQAAGSVGSPQLRNMGTIGGNICLDTRCVYYNQMQWKGSFALCYKGGGDKCHVVKGGSRCYALFCADTPAALLSLDAHLLIANRSGTREISLTEFYQNDGLHYRQLKNNEVLTGIKIPVEDNRVSVYSRFSVRKALEFPIVGVGLNVRRDLGGNCEDFRIAVTGIQSQPVRMQALERALGDRNLDSEKLDELIAEELKELVMVRHGGISPYYKKELLGNIIKGSLSECLHKGGGKHFAVNQFKY
jgi:4-hydroxybenzoyl-CoA reductase subunit beta